MLVFVGVAAYGEFVWDCSHVLWKLYLALLVVNFYKTLQFKSIADHVDTLVFLFWFEKYFPEIFIVPLYIKPYIFGLINAFSSLA